MKKVLSILLCVLMLAGIMAMSASAARSFQYAEVEVIQPIPGFSPEFYASVIEPEEGLIVSSDYTYGDYYNGVAWYDNNAGQFMTEDDVFVEGNTYTCYVWIEIEEYDDDIDYNFDAYIGAPDSGADNISSNIARVFGSFVCEKCPVYAAQVDFDYSLEYCELVYAHQPRQDGVADVDRSYNSNGFVRGVKWFANGVAVKNGERFKPNTDYTLQVRFVPNPSESYEFVPSVEAYVLITETEANISGTVISYDSDYIVAEFNMGNTGHPAKGLYTSSDGKKFYFTSDGTMYTKRLASVNGKKYYFGADGVAYTKKLISVDGKKYYMGADGVAYTSRLISVSGKKYYMGKDGVAYTKKLISVDGKKYYMGADGVAYTSKLISVDGKKYYMGKDGVAYKSKLISVSGKKYYIGKDCIAYKSKFASLSGKKYYFGSDCVMYKSKTFSVSGVKWRADSNGVCKKV